MIERTFGLPASWDEEVDFVVVGSGGAGLTGAIVAAIEGASVALLEKTGLVGGTTAVSGGGFWIPINDHAAEVGVEDNRDDALAYLRASASGAGEDEILVALVDQGHEAIRLLEQRAGCSFRSWPGKGATIDYRPELPGARHGGRTLDAGNVALADLGDWSGRIRHGGEGYSVADRFTDRLPAKAESHHALPPDPSRNPPLGEGAGEHVVAGTALVAQLLRACIAHGVRIHVEAPARELLVENGVVVGVRAEQNGQPFLVRARHGVLMATGGFSHNEELKRLWLDRPLETSCEIEENQGDGHLMGMAVGAQTAGLGDAWWMMAGAGHVNRYLPHTLIVNRDAVRFCNEALNYYDFGFQFGTRRDSPDGRPRNLPAWLLFDAQGARRYSVLAGIVATGNVPPEKIDRRDSRQARMTTLTEADTLPELAGKLGLDAARLAETVERFNGFAREGYDPDFHRGESRWAHAHADPHNKPNPSLGTLEEGPFYAVEIKSGSLATRGGLRVNHRAEVISAADGRPIPGLYAAGNCSNGATPLSYPGAGATIGAGMTFGYIAARQIAARLT